MGDGPVGAAKAAMTALAASAGSWPQPRSEPIRSLLNSYVLPKPGTGPSLDKQQGRLL